MNSVANRLRGRLWDRLMSAAGCDRLRIRLWENLRDRLGVRLIAKLMDDKL